MRARKLLVAIACLLALLAVVYWSVTSLDSGASAPQVSSSASAESPPLTAELATSTEPAVERATEIVAAVAEPATTPTSNECELRGRVLFPGGSPVRNATVRLQGFAANAQRVELHGTPKDWHDLDSTTDADGRFRVRFVPPRAFQFVLDLRATLYVPVTWRWSTIEPGEVKDLGDIELERGAAIVGRIVDGRGRTLAGEWTVSAQPAEGELGKDRQRARSSARADPLTRAYSLDAVRPGKVRVSASSSLGSNTVEREVEVAAGATVELELVYGGPDLARRIVVSPSVERMQAFSPLVVALDMHGPGGDRHIEGSRNTSRFEIDDLEPGSYSFSITDPRFEPWGESGVVPGTRVRAVLRGNAAIALSVIDAASATQLEGYSVALRIVRPNSSPQIFPLLEAGAAPPADSVYRGIVPGDYELAVRAPGKVECVVLVQALAPGETRAVVAKLGAGATIDGRVVEADGHTPTGDVEVTLARAGVNEALLRLTGGPTLTRSTRTTGDGRFHFEGLPNVNVELRALYSVHVASPPVSVSREASDNGDEVVLVLPGWGRLHGRVRVPDAEAASSVRLNFTPRGVSPEEQQRLSMGMMRERERYTFELAADGSYTTGPLPAGKCAVVLSLPMYSVKTERWRQSIGAGEIELGYVLVVAGADTAHDFDAKIAFPGRLAVHVRGEEALGQRWLVQATAAQESNPGQAFGMTDEQGDLALPTVLPGDYWIDVSPLDRTWLQVQPQPIHVESGRETAITIDVRTWEGVLAVRDNSGPLIATDVWVISLTPTYRSSRQTLRTDERGELKLRLPAGKLRIQPVASRAVQMSSAGRLDEPGASVDVEWTAAGPVPATVTLPESR